MAILGVQTVVFGVEDLPLCRKFFDDFGLNVHGSSDEHTDYHLAEGSHVILLRSDDPTLPPAFAKGSGVRLVVWGVDSQASLDRLEAELKTDRQVTTDSLGRIHTVDDAGLPIAFCILDS